MGSSLLPHVGREGTFEAQGKTWRFGRWGLGVWERITEQARKDLPDPAEIAIQHVERIQLSDAAVIRKLKALDEAETKAAKAEGRAPVLLSPGFRSTADSWLKMGLDKSCLYLSATSDEMASWLADLHGQSIVLMLLMHEFEDQMGVTKEDAFDLMKEIGAEEFTRITKTANGEMPPPKNAQPAQPGPPSQPSQSPSTGAESQAA